MSSFVRVSLSVCALACLLMPGCAPAPEKASPRAQIANPASVHCVSRGGKLEIRKLESGEAGFCHLPDGSVIDEWVLFRRDHRAEASAPRE